MKNSIPAFLILLVFTGCSKHEKQSGSLFPRMAEEPFIEGTSQYLSSPFVTAGDRLYIIGYQDGSFPDIGWHITGEMGGIWDHPVKLMDGFLAGITDTETGESICLDKAVKFVSFPMASTQQYSWEKENILIRRFQFVPDSLQGAFVEYNIVNNSTVEKKLNFSFTGMTDLRPVWLGERTNMMDAEDSISYHKELSAVIARDKKNPWFTEFGSSLEATGYSEDQKDCPSPVRKGPGKNGTLTYSLILKAGEEKAVPFFIAGSYHSEDELKSTYEFLKKESAAELTRKINRYTKISSNSRLTIPDKKTEQMYTWLKYNIDWLVRNVPEQGIGLSAGLPDYPWWFGADASYSLQGALATGYQELAKNTIILLNKISKATNNNGRIIHEASTNGSVYNPGNVNETAQFINLCLTYFEWTGDKEFMVKIFPDIQKGLKWLLDEKDPDRNGYPNGNGMMEIQGLNTEMIDVAVYTQQALSGAAEIAMVLGKDSLSAEYQRSADRLKVKINKEWWNDSAGSYADFRGTAKEAMPILRSAMIRADTLGKPWAVAELKATERKISHFRPDLRAPQVIYHNWVVNTPLEAGIADTSKARIALQTARKYENPFGVYVTGIDRTEQPDSEVLKSRKKTFSYTGAVMTLPTGVEAVAAANYGTPDDVLRYLTMLSRSFSYALPGSMYEVSPDFGMVTQAWNIYGVAVPIVDHLFGIHPKAYDKTIYVSPDLPPTWNEAALDNVRVGNNSLSIKISAKPDHKEYRISQTLPDWNIMVDTKHAKQVFVNEKEAEIKNLKDHMLSITGKENVVRIY